MRSYNTPPPAYQPLQRAFEAIGDPDDLIRQIPEMDFAVADFNSVTMYVWLCFEGCPSGVYIHGWVTESSGWLCRVFELNTHFILNTLWSRSHGNTLEGQC